MTPADGDAAAARIVGRGGRPQPAALPDAPLQHPYEQLQQEQYARYQERLRHLVSCAASESGQGAEGASVAGSSKSESRQEQRRRQWQLLQEQQHREIELMQEAEEKRQEQQRQRQSQLLEHAPPSLAISATIRAAHTGASTATIACSQP